jgi:hypothetical protein
MAQIIQEKHIARVHGPGTLLVCSDIHGNLEDMQRMVSLMEDEEDAALLFLGDLFHGPNVTEDQWARLYSHLADYYPDQSAEVFRYFCDLRQRHPERVHSLLGNHDHAHIGGPVVSKFYHDEAGAMEETLETEEIPALPELLRTLPVLVVSDCGAAFMHASPPERDFHPQELHHLELEGYEHVPLHAMYRYDLLGEMLWRRGSSSEGAARFLERLHQADVGPRCSFVVHGHEIARSGWELEHERALNLSTSFGMLNRHKHYLRLDLEQRYQDAAALSLGVEVLSLYPDAV